MRIFLCLCALLFPWPFLALAESSPCEVRTTQDILDCALKNHPDVAVSQAALERDLALKSVAKQRPNPELEHKIVSGTSSAANDLETESSLLHTMELGGKRKARVSQATAIGQVSSADRRKTLEEVALTTVLTLNRLRQIREELVYLRESLVTFKRILGQLKTRPLLSPEQSVSQTVFAMAREQYLLKETALLTEQEQLKTSLEFSTGLSFTTMQRHLPSAKSSWPTITQADDATADSGEWQKARAEMGLASAELVAAKSQSWPDLKIGPTVQTANPSGAGRTGTSVGGTISLPLPLLNLNRGGRRFAAAEKARAEVNLRVTGERLAAERHKQAERYQNGVKILSQTHSSSQLSTKHKMVDDLFERGLAPSTLVIECHRQMIEIIQSVHEQELASLDSLWRLYIIDGRVLEEKI